MSGPRRVFTLPTKLSQGTKRSGVQEEENGLKQIETLFVHPNATIISFNTAGHSKTPPKGNKSADDATVINDDGSGILPWRTSTERLVASGPMRIYRVPGSVAFLNAGSFLKPVLARSQCWCVDGETKFVLKRGLHDFYRIELPNEATGDREVAEEFGKALDQILRFEKTPCPFKRGFIVELPENPQVTYVPWKPKHRPVSPIRWENTNSTDRHMEQSELPTYSDQVTFPESHQEKLNGFADYGIVDLPTKTLEGSLASLHKKAPLRSVQPKIGIFENLDKYHERGAFLSIDLALPKTMQKSMSTNNEEVEVNDVSTASCVQPETDVKDLSNQSNLSVSAEARRTASFENHRELIVGDSLQNHASISPLSHNESFKQKKEQRDSDILLPILDSRENASLSSSARENDLMDKTFSDATGWSGISDTIEETPEGGTGVAPKKQTEYHLTALPESMDDLPFPENRDTENSTMSEGTEVVEYTSSEELDDIMVENESYEDPLSDAGLSETRYAHELRSDIQKFPISDKASRTRPHVEHDTTEKETIDLYQTSSSTQPDSLAPSIHSPVTTTNYIMKPKIDNGHLTPLQTFGPRRAVLPKSNVSSSPDDTHDVINGPLLVESDEPDTPLWHSATETPVLMSMPSIRTVDSDQSFLAAGVISSPVPYTRKASHSLSRTSSPQNLNHQEIQSSLLEQRQSTRSKSPLAFQTRYHLPSQNYERVGSIIGEKMAGILLGPPLKLATLMLRIATKFTNGVKVRDEFGEGWSRRGEDGRKLPGAWEYYSEDEREFESDWDDEYGTNAYGIEDHDVQELRKVSPRTAK